MQSDSLDATIASVSSRASLGGGGVAFIGGLSANEIAAFGGLAVAIIGLFLNWFYRHRADIRETKEHKARVDRWIANLPRPMSEVPPHMREDNGD